MVIFYAIYAVIYLSLLILFLIEEKPFKVPPNRKLTKDLSHSLMSANFVKWPKNSKWRCRLFGIDDYYFIPSEGNHPNWFWRWTQYLIFGNKWTNDNELI